MFAKNTKKLPDILVDVVCGKENVVEMDNFHTPTETPLTHQSRRLTPRRPLLDVDLAFNSTTGLFQLKLEQVSDTIE
jgi:hypothetical protein